MTMRARTIVPAIIGLCVMAISSHAAEVKVTEQVEKSVNTIGLRKIAIVNVQGKTVVTGERKRSEVKIVAKVTVRGETRAKAQAVMDALVIKIELDGSELGIGVERPDKGDDDGIISKGAVTVDFDIRVPVRMNVGIAQVRGLVRVKRVNDLDVVAVTSKTFVSSVSGEVSLASVSGDVSVKLGKRPSETLTISTVTGDAVVQMPMNANATVSIAGLLVSSKIQNLRVTRDDDGSFTREVIIGDGGIPVKLATVSGRFTIRGY
jgi:hypothetical protein